MKIELSPLIAQAKGPFGGLDYYQLNGKQVVRTLPSVVPEASPAQQAVRDNYIWLWELFDQLFTIPRNSWDAPSAVDILPAWAHFLQLNYGGLTDPSAFYPTWNYDEDIAPPVDLDVTPVSYTHLTLPTN